MPIRFLVGRLKRFFIYRVLHVDDTPHRIALGVAVGIFVTWTPTIGFQMALTVALSALLRANKFVGVPFVWISNPLTLAPVYGPSYAVGCWLLGGKHSMSSFVDFVMAASHSGPWAERVSAAWQAMWAIFVPLWVGSLVVALALGIASYFLTRYAVIKYREHWQRSSPKPPWEKDAPEPAEPDRK